MSADQAEENKIMDFESDIASWVIDKEDSNGLPISFDKSQKEHSFQSQELKTMNKENIKQSSHSDEKKSLRYFRINKKTNCQGPPSDSDCDKRNLYYDNDDSTNWNKRNIFEFPQAVLNDKGLPNSKQHSSSSSSSLSSLSEIRKDTGSLSSEEISAMLSEVEGSSDTIQEKNRERLHSIENVSTLVDSKDHSNASISPTLKPFFNCTTCNCEYQSLEELKCHEVVHRKSDVQAKSQHYTDQPANQGQKKSSLALSGSVCNSPDFLGTFKTHLIRQGAIPPDVTDRILSVGKDAVEKGNPKNPFKTTVQKVLTCKVCPFSCFELLIFKTHQIMFHSVSQILNCEYCQYETKFSADLATHIRVHFQLACPRCDYKCTLKNTLDAHLRDTHVDLKCYKCKKCDCSCKSKRKFKKHLHKVTSRYQCGDCNLFFLTKQVLKLHMRSHEQLYVCATCNTKFNKKNSLEIHMKVHTKALLKCEKCNSTFTKKNYLTLHMRIHVAESFKCKDCHFEGSNSSDLAKHICINKLYKVQRRSLVFSKTESGTNSEVKKAQDESKNKDENTKNKNSVEQTDHTEQTPANGKNKKLMSRCKVLTLRQNLPSRKNKVVEIESSKTIREIPKYLRKSVLKEENKSLNKFVPAAKKNGSYRTHSKQNTWIVSTKNQTDLRDQRKYKGRIRKAYMSSSLNSVQILLTKKSSPKELFIDARRFINERFVQCYYQNQQVTTTHQEHVERHMRQRSILSCRFCRYKTNSDQLLQQHTMKNHSWDPAFVSWLFR